MREVISWVIGIVFVIALIVIDKNEHKSVEYLEMILSSDSIMEESISLGNIKSVNSELYHFVFPSSYAIVTDSTIVYSIESPRYPKINKPVDLLKIDSNYIMIYTDIYNNKQVLILLGGLAER